MDMDDRSSGQKILIIDNDEMDLEWFRIILSKEGYNVLMTADGPQGILLYQTHTPALTLVDLGLPSTSGFEVLREIRNIDKKAKVMLISAYGSIESAVIAIRSGALDFVWKTYDVSVILKKIKNALDLVMK